MQALFRAYSGMFLPLRRTYFGTTLGFLPSSCLHWNPHILDIYLLSMLADAICCPNKFSKRHGPYNICNSYTKSIYDPDVLRFLLGRQTLSLQEQFFSHIFLFRQHVSSATVHSKNVSRMF